MRIKPLLIARRRCALALPALAQQAAQPRQPAARGIARPGRSRDAGNVPRRGAASTGGGRERGRGSQSRSTCRRRRRRSNIRAGRGAIRGSSERSTRPRRARRRPVGRGERRVPVDPDAADGHADRVALGAYRASRRVARQGARAAQRQSGRLGRRARLAAAAHGRGGRRADARRRRRYRPVHAQDGSRSRCRARSPTPTRRPCARSRTASANMTRGIRSWSRRCARRLPASPKPRRRRSTRPGATGGSAESTSRLPRRWSARAPKRPRATIEWDPVDQLTAWRFGLATGDRDDAARTG